MGVYIYRLNSPKQIAGEKLGLLKYWDKPSYMSPERDKPLMLQRNDLEVGREYVSADSWNCAHGASIMKDTTGGWNYWYDTDGRFEDTGRVLVKYGKRWEIIPATSYIKTHVPTGNGDDILSFELYHGDIVCAKFNDWFNGKQLSEWKPMTQEDRNVMERFYHKLEMLGNYEDSNLERFMLTTGIRFAKVSLNQSGRERNEKIILE